MTTIAVACESQKSERRIGLSPETAKKFAALGCRVKVESGAGKGSYFSDKDYEEAGATIAKTAAAALKGADIVLTVRRPPAGLLKSIRKDAVVIGLLDPFDGANELRGLAKSGVTAFAVELMPRISRAQSMDVLSSQSNLAGYKAVIDAAATFNRAMPMMMTAAGTIPPARVFVMGAGVAGLQAIATARRLGAVVTATDVRPVAKEQVESLGAKFVAVDDEEFKQAETEGGYAKEMSANYKAKQDELVAEHLRSQDIVITTALIPGRPAPILINSDMVKTLRPGAIIVDLAVERGGNCELSKPGKDVEKHGVTILGRLNRPGDVSVNASSLYARNLFAFIEPMIDKDKQQLAIDWDDEIIAGTLISKGGKLVHRALTKEKAS